MFSKSNRDQSHKRYFTAISIIAVLSLGIVSIPLQLASAWSVTYDGGVNTITINGVTYPTVGPCDPDEAHSCTIGSSDPADYPTTLANDADEDRILDSFETSVLGTSTNSKDSDGDGIDDWVELYSFGTNPADSDTDGDGSPDFSDPDPLDSAVYAPIVDTRIKSAIDGFGNSIPNGGWTLSTNMTLFFRGVDQQHGVSGFQCRVDSLPDIARPYIECTSPVSFGDLPSYVPQSPFPGRQAARVFALDSNGNADPTPAVWRWVILAPSQGVQKLLNMIHNLSDLPSPDQTKADLLAPLKGIMWKLDGRNPDNVLDDSVPDNHLPICEKLSDFISEVNAKESNGDITSAQALKIGKMGNDLKASISCP